VLEDPWNAPPEDAFAWTAPPDKRPSQAEEIVIGFEAGEPSWNALRGASLVRQLNAAAGAHGFGRIDLIEDRVVGMKSREVYECPGSLTLLAAHQALERLVLTRDELRFKSSCDQRYAELVYDGLWSSPLRDALDAFNAASAPRVTGTVRMRLGQGLATVVGVKSPYALYDESLATYGAGDAFDHRAAEGFIRLHGLQLHAAARVATSPVSA
jgi:argininosuccinate synthase